MIRTDQYSIKFHHDVPAGMTECSVRDEYTDIRTTSVAYCHINDQFCKETGRKVALTRAIADLPKETRAAIWKAYFNRKAQ